jgi:hypothetical protein
MTLIRYEQEGMNIWALWEGQDGERWYEQIVIEGVVQW